MRDPDLIADGDAVRSARLVYLLYLSSLVFGITLLIGLILAYVYRGSAPHWVAQHFRYQIRTFWLGVLYTLAGGLSMPVLIGFVILALTLIWFIVRCAVGLYRLGQSLPPAQPSSWLV